MTFAEAKKLRDFIRSYGPWCTVPTGYKPDRYFARILRWDEAAKKMLPVDFHDWLAARKDMAEMLCRERATRARCREFKDREWFRLNHPPRSPLDAMIDRACGLAGR
jgi:hypothetical protein